MADAVDSKSTVREGVGVRVPSPAPTLPQILFGVCGFFILLITT